MSECQNNNPCCTPAAANESLASQLQNLITTLLGTFVVTVVNGRGTWSAVCNPNSSGLACYPRATGEGFICYFLRVLEQIALFVSGPWVISTAYCKNTIVAYGNSLYVALQATTGNQPDISPTYWMILITAPAGPAGNQGPPGSSSGGLSPNYATIAITTDYTATDADGVILGLNAGAAIVTIPDTLTLSGKWFVVNKASAGNITIQMSGTDTLNGAASFLLTTPTSSVTFVRNALLGDWYII